LLGVNVKTVAALENSPEGVAFGTVAATARLLGVGTDVLFISDDDSEAAVQDLHRALRVLVESICSAHISTTEAARLAQSVCRVPTVAASFTSVIEDVMSGIELSDAFVKVQLPVDCGGICAAFHVAARTRNWNFVLRAIDELVLPYTAAAFPIASPVRRR
jgi:hypothetical protein